MVTTLCREWSGNSNPQRDWIIKHGLRGLIKDGDKQALKLIGYAKPTGIDVKLKLSGKQVAIGESVGLQARLSNTGKKKQKLLIDYIVHYQGKSSASRRKVFKWKSIELKAGESMLLEKKHPMKRTTIRALYPGNHTVELQLNGESVASQKFSLSE